MMARPRSPTTNCRSRCHRRRRRRRLRRAPPPSCCVVRSSTTRLPLVVHPPPSRRLVCLQHASHHPIRPPSSSRRVVCRPPTARQHRHRLVAASSSCNEAIDQNGQHVVGRQRTPPSSPLQFSQPTNPIILLIAPLIFQSRSYKFSIPNHPLTKKKVVKTTLCTTVRAQLPPKYSGFREGVLELLCWDIQCLSWKYDNGSIINGAAAAPPQQAIPARAPGRGGQESHLRGSD